MKKYKLGVIGAGAMAEAIIRGIIKANIYQPNEILVSNRSSEKLISMQNSLQIEVASSNDEIISQCRAIIVAVKPQQLSHLGNQLSQKCDNNQLVISIMAGVTTNSIAQVFGQCPVVRVMPNTPAQLGYAMSAVCSNQLAKEEDIEQVLCIFNSIGETIVISEEQIDAAGAISGSGPAYMYQFIEALADAGVMLGLPRKLAYTLAAQTMVGSGQMVLQTGEHPAVLKDQVTSPGGTTIRAIEVLEQKAVRGAIIEAVEQAHIHSRKLGEVNK